MTKSPLLTDVLEPYRETLEGLTMWKRKGISLTCENLLHSTFFLSVDIAEFFNLRHDHLLNRNIAKLQEEGYLPYHMYKIVHMIATGKSAKRQQTIYALNRHQTERIIVDFTGAKARKKKYAILIRLQMIEEEVLRGAYAEARKKAQEFDGIQLLDDLGFTCSAGERLATKKDIARFLNVPESTVSGFLRKHRDQIEPVALSREQIHKLGSRANRMNAYRIDDVLKIAFWMQSEVGVELKRRLLGDASVLVQCENRKEMEWRSVLGKVFAGFDLRYNYPVGRYKVDYVVRDLLLCLELDESHDGYDLAEEEERENYISRHYTLIRFRTDTKLEDLLNAILKAQIKQVIRLYG